MGANWGKILEISIFGESHGNGIGINIGGLPSGFTLDLDKINIDMARRAPGKSKLTTPRNEKDQFEILSGFFEGKTTGTPLCSIIRNTNQRSKDYSKIKDILRPGHADYSGKRRYEDANDYRGGGHFSGRITAPLVFAGSVAKQILETKGIKIGTHISSIKDVEDKRFFEVDITEELLNNLTKNNFPLLDESLEKPMTDKIMEAKEQHDSTGGTIECCVLNMPAGIGNPFFDSIESRLSSMLYSIPAIKGVEFGLGFDISKLSGSEANDELYIENGEIKSYSNNNGGITGGITNGEPIIFRVAVKPTPSIGKTQKTVNIATGENTDYAIVGRHDPCIIPRALVVVEAAAALVMLDFLMEKRSI